MRGAPLLPRVVGRRDRPGPRCRHGLGEVAHAPRPGRPRSRTGGPMNGTDERLRQHFRRAAPEVVPDDTLLPALRTTADRRRHRRRIATGGIAAVAAAAVAVLGLAVTSTDDGPTENVEVVAPAPDESQDGGGGARDWDGARFDFGRIERVHRDGDELLLDFDRTQL